MIILWLCQVCMIISVTCKLQKIFDFHICSMYCNVYPKKTVTKLMADQHKCADTFICVSNYYQVLISAIADRPLINYASCKSCIKQNTLTSQLKSMNVICIPYWNFWTKPCYLVSWSKCYKLLCRHSFSPHSTNHNRKLSSVYEIQAKSKKVTNDLKSENMWPEKTGIVYFSKGSLFR